jgi:broad specificity phosphatase PhoE
VNELILVRHGEAEHITGEKTGGWSDAHLTDLGQKQARMTGIYLRRLLGERPYNFYSSDLPRASETAELISKALGVKPICIPGLRELNNGVAATMTKQEAEKVQIPISAPMIDWAPYPGAESWREMSCRVRSCLDSIHRNDQDLVIIVLHAGCAEAAVHWWLKLEPDKHNISFDLDTCGVTHLRINDWGEKTIARLNDTSHLINPNG